MTDLRDALKEPDRFQLFKLLHDLVPAKELHAFEGGEGGAAASFPDQRVSLAMGGNSFLCAPVYLSSTKLVSMIYYIDSLYMGHENDVAAHG